MARPWVHACCSGTWWLTRGLQRYQFSIGFIGVATVFLLAPCVQMNGANHQGFNKTLCGLQLMCRAIMLFLCLTPGAFGHSLQKQLRAFRNFVKCQTIQCHQGFATIHDLGREYTTNAFQIRSCAYSLALVVTPRLVFG
jgi:hypothetical protein